MQTELKLEIKSMYLLRPLKGTGGLFGAERVKLCEGPPFSLFSFVRNPATLEPLLIKYPQWAATTTFHTTTTLFDINQPQIITPLPPLGGYLSWSRKLEPIELNGPVINGCG